LSSGLFIEENTEDKKKNLNSSDNNDQKNLEINDSSSSLNILEINLIKKILDSGDIILETKEELVLAKHLIKIDEILFEVSEDLSPNKVFIYYFYYYYYFLLFFDYFYYFL
jgi:hypothetical protein